MTTPMFVHLRTHSEFSLIDGLTRIPELAAKAADFHMPAVALTDHANLYALVKFYRACQRHGVKPLCGADLWIVDDEDLDSLSLLTFLVQNDSGYRNLTQVISRAYQEGQRRGQVT
ncbi:MAG: PHP domain-containing protein, partial [Pseudomonadales bacterium]